jgi:hypothetical protein
VSLGFDTNCALSTGARTNRRIEPPPARRGGGNPPGFRPTAASFRIIRIDADNPNLPMTQQQDIPGIPNNIPRYVPPQQRTPTPQKSDDDEDDGDGKE